MTTRGRTPTKTTPENPGPKVNDAALAETEQAAKTLAQVNGALNEGIAFGQIIGRIQMAAFVGNVSDATLVACYEEAKKSTTWRGLPVPGGNGETFKDFDQFCQKALGKTDRRFRQIVGNRSLLGQAAFEQAEQLGLRQVDYNAIKALPAPEQELVRRAVQETKTRDEVVSLIEELASRSAQREQASTKVIEDERKEHAATKRRLEATVKMRDRAEAEAARITTLEPNEALAELRAEASKKTAAVLGMVQGHLRQALLALSHEEQDQSTFMASLVGEVVRDLARLRDEFQLVDLSNAEDAARAAEVEQWAGPAKKKG